MSPAARLVALDQAPVDPAQERSPIDRAQVRRLLRRDVVRRARGREESLWGHSGRSGHLGRSRKYRVPLARANATLHGFPRHNEREIRVALLPRAGRGVDWETLRSLGVTRFVVKPAIPQQLLSIVREIIEPEPAGPRR